MSSDRLVLPQPQTMLAVAAAGMALLNTLLMALLLASPAQAQQMPTFFFQTSVEPFFATERGDTRLLARGPAAAIRPIAGLTGKTIGDANLTVLGGASATRYAETPASNADSLFAMANLSKTVEGTRFGLAFLAANSKDPTFATGVAKIYDTTLSVGRTFTPEALDGWSLTPQLKAARRMADAEELERWNLGAAIEFARPAFGGIFSFSGGYDWLPYVAEGRRDNRYFVSSSWTMDVSTNVQVGVRADASFLNSNTPGRSVNSLEIGPILRVLFTK